MKKVVGYIFSFLTFISMYYGAMLYCSYLKELVEDPIMVDIAVSIVVILTTIINCVIIGVILYLMSDEDCHPIDPQYNRM